MQSAFQCVGLTGKPGDDAVHDVLSRLADQLAGMGVVVCTDEKELSARADLIVCVGGDGSLLHAARVHGLAGIPLVGVNLGRLGFLVDVSPDRVADDLARIIAGTYVEEHRMALQMQVFRTGEPVADGVALNDVVLHKADPGRLLDFSTHINGTGVTTHRADGMVVATPTGSTAYALSGGGPILHPAMDAIALVPICPHTLSDRPVVIPGASEIMLTVGEGAGGAAVSCDGRPGTALSAGDRVVVSRSSRTVRLLHPHDYDFFRILREKLHWGRAPDPA